MKTGYFARATEDGHSAKFTKVHIVNIDGNSICGYRPHKTMKLKWCSSGVYLCYVDCKKCKQKWERYLNSKVYKELMK